jgi:hypothetical protein
MDKRISPEDVVRKTKENRFDNCLTDTDDRTVMRESKSYHIQAGYNVFSGRKFFATSRDHA